MAFETLILHIGRHKTGTSALQHCLARSGDVLRAQGVIYPATGRGQTNAHNPLARQMNPNLTTGSTVPGLMAAIEAERRAAGAETVLISAEGLQNVRHLQRLRAAVDLLAPRQVVVVCYLRECVDYAVSAWRQVLQAQRRAVPFGEYLQKFGDLSVFLARWRAVGDLRLRWFDLARLEGGDICRDFGRQTGIAGLQPPAGNVNPSIGGNLLYLLYLANRDGRPFPGYKAMGDLALAHPPFGQGFRIPPELLAQARRPGGYNASVEPILGPAPLRDWSGLPDLPDLGSLGADALRVDQAILAAGGAPWTAALVRDTALVSIL
ncbi:MAG: hypothetical protein IE927_08245 [Rhodobacterales bacterium]|nr:hypothetical protein [Rhodobacterales bacterium]